MLSSRMRPARVRRTLIHTVSRRTKLSSRRLSTAPPDSIVEAPVRSIWRNEGFFVRVGVAATIVTPTIAVLNPLTITMRVEANMDDFFKAFLKNIPEDDKLGQAIVGAVTGLLFFPVFGVPYVFVKTLIDVVGLGLVAVVPVYCMQRYVKREAPHAWSRAMWHLGVASCVGVLAGSAVYIASTDQSGLVPTPREEPPPHPRPAPAAPGAPAFIKAKAFAGAKPGYVFKEGPRGVGYYTDTPPLAPQRRRIPAAPAARSGKKGAERMVRTASRNATALPDDGRNRGVLLFGTITLGMIAAAVIVVASGEK